MNILAMLFLLAVVGAIVVSVVIVKMRGPCPVVYAGWEYDKYCIGKNCDHSSHAWAVLGIDKDELVFGQPYRRGWLDPKSSKYREEFYDRYKEQH